MVGPHPREGGRRRGAEGQPGGGPPGGSLCPLVHGERELESGEALAANWMGRCPQRRDTISSHLGAEVAGMRGRCPGLSPQS